MRGFKAKRNTGKARAAVATMQATSKRLGNDTMTLREINAEIAAYRKSLRK